MKLNHFNRAGALALAGVVGVFSLMLAGCDLKQPEAASEPDAAGKRSVFGKSMEKATDLETDSNISQINSGLRMIKDNTGQYPATLEEAKAALKDYPASMWIDNTMNKPLAYDPTTGTVSRAP